MSHLNECERLPRFLPFDAGSPESEAYDVVLIELSGLLVNPSVSDFTVEQLAGGGHPAANNPGVLTLFDTFGPSAKRKLLGMVTQIIEDFRVGYLRREISRPTRDRRWAKADDIFTTGPAIASLQSKVTDFKRRREEGCPLPNELQSERLLDEDQLTLSEDDAGRDG